MIIPSLSRYGIDFDLSNFLLNSLFSCENCVMIACLPKLNFIKEQDQSFHSVPFASTQNICSFYVPQLELSGLGLISQSEQMLFIQAALLIGSKSDFSKLELTQPESLWFYGQFIGTFWCLWNHKNKVIFKNHSSNPVEIIKQQKCQIKWIHNVLA